MSNNVFIEVRKSTTFILNTALQLKEDTDPDFTIVYGDDYGTGIIYFETLDEIEEIIEENPEPKDFIAYLVEKYNSDELMEWVASVELKGGVNFFGTYEEMIDDNK